MPVIHRHKGNRPHFDVEGNLLVDTNKRFKVRNDIGETGDSVLIVKGNEEITGTLYGLSVMLVKIKYENEATYFDEYYRYEMIIIFSKNKLITATRSYNVLYDTELELYSSKVVLFEKYKNSERLKKESF
jgi:hypothetical protein